MSRSIEVGLVLPMMQRPDTGETPAWDKIKRLAQRAESDGFDTVWVADELLWRAPSWSGPRGWWECVAMCAAIAASTETVGIGTWVLSALHRNPALTAKVAHTLDEVSGGRLLFGFGAGHAGKQGEAFGYPTEKTVSRYAEALEIIVPALRGKAVTFDGEYHQASELEILPLGPRQGAIPLMLAGHGPRNMRLAAQYGDIWSGFATESSQPDWFVPMLERLDQSCEAVGRDPGSLGKSIGVVVEPGDESTAEEVGWGMPLDGPPPAIAEAIARFAELGLTRIELMVWPGTEQDLDAVQEALNLSYR